MRLVLSVTTGLLVGGLTLHLQPLLAGENEKTKPAILTINEQQRSLLSAAKAWKVEVTCAYPYDLKKGDGIPIREDCERLLKRAGWGVDEKNGTIAVQIRVTGAARSAAYNATPSTRYSGADITINASITTLDSPRKTIATFAEAKGVQYCPGFIGGGYLAPSDAPYEDAYKECRDFHTQLLSVIHAVKGARAAYECRNADTSVSWKYQDNLFAFVKASGDRAFVPLLVADLLGNENPSQNIAECLAELGDTRAVEPLCMSLVNKNGVVWLPAVNALARLGDPKAVPHLRGALLSAGPNSAQVAPALRTLKWSPETTREKVVYWIALGETKLVKEMRADAVATLIELLAAEKDAAPTAAQLLGELKEASAVGSLSRALLSAKPSNSWEGRALRSAAAKALSETGGPKVVEPLAMALMSDGDSDVRRACAAGLGGAEGEAAFKSLAQALASDRDGGVRTTCAAALGKRGGKAAVALLAKAVLEDKDDSVVMAAQDALGQLKDRGAVDCLLKSLNHKNSGIRTHAVRALRLIGDNKAVPAVGDRLKEETDQEARQAMVELLAELNVQPGTLPFEAHLSLLAKQRKWEDIRTFLNEQPTEKVIESLKLKEELVNTVARFILAQRTGKYDLRSYDDWKQWWKHNGGKPSIGETTEPRTSQPPK
jgi:HEAT repeat protein